MIRAAEQLGRMGLQGLPILLLLKVPRAVPRRELREPFMLVCDAGMPQAPQLCLL